MKTAGKYSRFLSLLSGIAAGLLAGGLAINVLWPAWAQSNNPGAPSEPVAGPEAWEFQRAFDRLAEATDRDELGVLAILHPAELEQVLAKLKSPEEKAAEALAEFAILNPAEYAALHPRAQPSEEALLAVMDEEGLARYVLTNATANFDQLKGQIGRGQGKNPDFERRKAEALAAMEHPERQPLPPPMQPTEPTKP